MLTDTDGIQVEKIAALQPDLILAVISGREESDDDWWRRPRRRLRTRQRPIRSSAWGGQLSTERVDLLDTDMIIWLMEGDGRKTVEANKAYTSLAVHREGRRSSPSRGQRLRGLVLLTVLSVGYLVEQLTPRLAAAVDGDPGTVTD